MDRGLDDQLSFLRAMGFEGVEHDSHVPFLVHLGAVRLLLIGWGARPQLRDAGLFHSVYGTEYFDADLEEVSRDEVRAVIGDEAEAIAWLWCTVRRDTIDADNRTAINRHTGLAIDLEPQQVIDLAELWVADMVEQVERLPLGERNPWQRLVELAPLTSNQAQAAFAAVCESLRRTDGES